MLPKVPGTISEVADQFTAHQVWEGEIQDLKKQLKYAYTREDGVKCGLYQFVLLDGDPSLVMTVCEGPTDFGVEFAKLTHGEVHVFRNGVEVVAIPEGGGIPAVVGYASTYIQKELAATFMGFRTQLVRRGTTTRQSDGAEAYDFWHYPLIDVMTDMDGDFTVTWRYINYLDGSIEYDSGDIVNTFPGLAGGRTERLELRDNREPSAPGGICNGVSCRDTRRGESIAYGDLEGLLDGRWHRFKSDVSVLVASPSGAVASTIGVLEESFKTVGSLVRERPNLKVEARWRPTMIRVSRAELYRMLDYAKEKYRCALAPEDMIFWRNRILKLEEELEASTIEEIGEMPCEVCGGRIVEPQETESICPICRSVYSRTGY